MFYVLYFQRFTREFNLNIITNKFFFIFLLSTGCENPKPCQTELTVLEFGLYDGDPATKVLLQPLTGKSTSFSFISYKGNKGFIHTTWFSKCEVLWCFLCIVYSAGHILGIKDGIKVWSLPHDTLLWKLTFFSPIWLPSSVFSPRPNPPAKGPLQCNRPPHCRGLHLQLGSRRLPLPHDAACPSSPHPSRTPAPARLCWGPLPLRGGSQVAPAALTTDTEGHRGCPAGTQVGGGKEAERGGERESEKRAGEKERKTGAEDWGGEWGAEEAVSGVAEWMGWRLMELEIILFILIYFSSLLVTAMLNMHALSHWTPVLHLNSIHVHGSGPVP